MNNGKKFEILKWTASFFGFCGAILIALNIDITKYAFFIFLCSSTLWIYAGLIMKEYSIVFLNVGFLMVDFIGIYRWMFNSVNL